MRLTDLESSWSLLAKELMDQGTYHVSNLFELQVVPTNLTFTLVDRQDNPVARLAAGHVFHGSWDSSGEFHSHTVADSFKNEYRYEVGIMIIIYLA